MTLPLVGPFITICKAIDWFGCKKCVFLCVQLIYNQFLFLCIQSIDNVFLFLCIQSIDNVFFSCVSSPLIMFFFLCILQPSWRSMRTSSSIRVGSINTQTSASPNRHTTANTTHTPSGSQGKAVNLLPSVIALCCLLSVVLRLHFIRQSVCGRQYGKKMLVLLWMSCVQSSPSSNVIVG